MVVNLDKCENYSNFGVHLYLLSKYNPKLNNPLARFCLLTCYIDDQLKNMYMGTNKYVKMLLISICLEINEISLLG